jgi:hypothetical protein
MGITERDSPRMVISDYTILITKIRYAIRKHKYFRSPLEKKAAFSIDGNELNTYLLNRPTYVNSKLNHPPSILRNIPLSVNKRLSFVSSSKEIFNQAAPLCQSELKWAG